jgi:hypothetical protein
MRYHGIWLYDWNYPAAQAHPPPQPAGFGASVLGQYAALNHPSPFRLKAVAEIIFSTAPPHSEHLLAGGSENFWRSSNWCLQLLQLYS